MFFSEAPVGTYQAWAENYSGRKAVRVTLTIAQGSVTLNKFVHLPASTGAESQHFPFDVSAR